MSDVTLVTKELDCQFSHDEIRNLGIAMAYTASDLEGLKEEKATFAKDMAGRMKEAKAKVNDLAAKIRHGSEKRMVDCNVEKDYIAKKVRTFRNDTKELVEERDMSEEERQQPLFLQTDPTDKVIRHVDLGGD